MTPTPVAVATGTATSRLPEGGTPGRRKTGAAPRRPRSIRDMKPLRRRSTGRSAAGNYGAADCNHGRPEIRGGGAQATTPKKPGINHRSAWSRG